MGNVNGMADMLTLIDRFVTNIISTTTISCEYLNMLAYCQIKAGHHRQSVNSILQSLRIFPSSCNAASGYLKIVLQILNDVTIRLHFEDFIRDKLLLPNTDYLQQVDDYVTGCTC